jgi:hypothetical protein
MTPLEPVHPPVPLEPRRLTKTTRSSPLSAGHDNRKILATAAPRVAELEDLAPEAGFDPAGYAGHWRLQLG